jgi:hypothetical protein
MTKIRVMGQEIKVVFVEGWVFDDDNRPIFGTYCAQDRTIRLSTAVPQDQLRATLFHELTHAVISMFQGGGTFKDACEHLDDPEEYVVRLMEAGLYSALLSNGEVADFLFRGGALSVNKD